MFIPIVPVVPHTTINNKTIVYNDTVLPLKDLGNNLKICSISSVSEYSLENCLRKIFESNPDVVFNTIQYSKENKKVYFYTDKTISTKAWEESKTTRYKPISNSKDILEEIKNILAQEKNKDTDCISLFDISKLIKSKNAQYKKMEESYDSKLEYAINSKYDDVGIYISRFDFNSNELVIKFRYFKTYDEIRFSKNNGDLFITESETYRGKDIFAILGNILSEAYDDFKEYKNFEKQNKYDLKSVNSIFLIEISGNNRVSIYSRSASKIFGKDFELSSFAFKNEYNYDCNSNTVISAIRGKEDEIFKRIFVKIDDCPEWSKETLYQIRQEQLVEEKRLAEEQLKAEIRQEQLVEEKRLAEEQLKAEIKKQKRLKLGKFFPWFNK